MATLWQLCSAIDRDIFSSDVGAVPLGKSESENGYSPPQTKVSDKLLSNRARFRPFEILAKQRLPELRCFTDKQPTIFEQW